MNVQYPLSIVANILLQTLAAAPSTAVFQTTPSRARRCTQRVWPTRPTRTTATRTRTTRPASKQKTPWYSTQTSRRDGEQHEARRYASTTTARECASTHSRPQCSRCNGLVVLLELESPEMYQIAQKCSTESRTHDDENIPMSLPHDESSPRQCNRLSDLSAVALAHTRILLSS